jgi:hypothetical protein
MVGIVFIKGKVHHRKKIFTLKGTPNDTQERFYFPCNNTILLPRNSFEIKIVFKILYLAVSAFLRTIIWFLNNNNYSIYNLNHHVHL